jgi:hypothetical protein
MLIRLMLDAHDGVGQHQIVGAQDKSSFGSVGDRNQPSEEKPMSHDTSLIATIVMSVIPASCGGFVARKLLLIHRISREP